MMSKMGGLIRPNFIDLVSNVDLAVVLMSKVSREYPAFLALVGRAHFHFHDAHEKCKVIIFQEGQFA